MATRSEWIKFPRKYITHKTIFGYKEFHSLWSLPDRPEAVVVFPDMVVRGVVAAVLELGVHRSNDVKFCFHRNSHVEVLCPFPALWAVNDGGRVADGLIDLVRRQHAGETVSPVKLSLEFQTSSGTV